MHARTVMGIAFILVIFVVLVQPRLQPQRDPRDLKVTIVPTTASGVVEIGPSATSTAVVHGLGRRPAQVLLTPNGPVDPSSGAWWVSDLSDQSFEVHLAAASASYTAAFFWQAIPPPQ